MPLCAWLRKALMEVYRRLCGQVVRVGEQLMAGALIAEVHGFRLPPAVPAPERIPARVIVGQVPELLTHSPELAGGVLEALGQAARPAQPRVDDAVLSGFGGVRPTVQAGKPTALAFQQVGDSETDRVSDVRVSEPERVPGVPANPGRHQTCFGLLTQAARRGLFRHRAPPLPEGLPAHRRGQPAGPYRCSPPAGAAAPASWTCSRPRPRWRGHLPGGTG